MDQRGVILNFDLAKERELQKKSMVDKGINMDQ